MRHESGSERSWHPTPRQELLLRASLLRGPACLEAWLEWKMDVDIDLVAMPSAGLLPLLYQNLLNQGLNEPIMEDLKKRYTTVWFQNQTSLHRMAGILSTLGSAGVESMLLKGAAMTVAYYRDHGVRPMGDVDVMTRQEDAARAADVLRASGLTSQASLSATRLRYMHGLPFADQSGFAVDLHWRLLWEFNPPNVEADFWERAVEVELGKASTRVLDPTDQLLHICIHGARWNSAPVRWVADAVTLINGHSSELDFGRLAEKAQGMRLHLPMCYALRYLQRTWSAPVPEEVIEALEIAPTSWMERTQYHYLASPREHKPLGNLPMHLFRFMRITRGDGFIRRLIELPKFLAFAWRLDAAGRIPASILGKAIRRVRMAFGSRSGR